MVLVKIIRIILGMSIFILMTALFSCEEIVIVNCVECESAEPMEVNLEIRVDDNPGGVMVNIYEGKLEDKVLFKQITTNNRLTYQKVPLNKSYTLTAEYYKGEKTYVVVNSVLPRVKYEEEKCKEPCYYIYDFTVDLHLKYSK